MLLLSAHLDIVSYNGDILESNNNNNNYDCLIIIIIFPPLQAFDLLCPSLFPNLFSCNIFIGPISHVSSIIILPYCYLFKRVPILENFSEFGKIVNNSIR